MTRASRLLALRVLFSLAVLAVLIHQFGGGEIADIMLSCDPLLFAAAVALFLVGQWLNALRWRMLLIAGASRSPPLHDLYALIMAGSFFNFFLPSTVGGDLFRAELARHHVGGRRHAYGSIVVGRLLALLAVLALAAGGLAAWLLLSGRPASGIAVVVTGAVFAGAIVAAMHRVRTRLEPPSRLPDSRLGRTLRKAVEFLEPYLTRQRVLLSVFGLAVVSNIVGEVFAVSVLAAGIDVGVPLLVHFIAVPVILLVTLVPVTVNGIGLREAAAAYLYAALGGEADAAVALLLTFTGVLAVTSLLGGLVLLVPRYCAIAEIRREKGAS